MNDLKSSGDTSTTAGTVRVAGAPLTAAPSPPTSGRVDSRRP